MSSVPQRVLAGRARKDAEYCRSVAARVVKPVDLTPGERADAGLMAFHDLVCALMREQEQLYLAHAERLDAFAERLETGSIRPSRPKVAGLTAKQREVLEFVLAYAMEHGYPPSLREIGAGVYLLDIGGVRRHLSFLEEKGYISREKRMPRGLRILRRPDGTLLPRPLPSRD